MGVHKSFATGYIIMMLKVTPPPLSVTRNPKIFSLHAMKCNYVKLII